jgi:multidrug resistance protein MdtO
MAPLAGDARPNFLELLLEPTPGRLGFSVRLALICALTTLVVAYYRDPEPALTAYVAFFMLKPDRTTSVLLSVVFVLLISLVLGALILVTKTVINDPVGRVTTMAVLSFGLLFAGSASKLKPVAAIVALIAGYALDLMARVEFGEEATRALLYAWLFIGIPAGVSIVVNLLIGPAPRRLAERALADRLRRCAAVLRRPGAETRRALEVPLQEGPGEIPAWLRLAGLEKTSPPKDLAALAQAATSTTEILLLVEVATRDPECALPAGVRLKVAEQLDQMAGILAAGGYPTEVIPPEAAGKGSLPALSAAVLAELREAMARFAEPPPAASKEPAAKAGGGFWSPDAFTNPEHVRYALKTTGAAMFCYVVYSLLDWPSIHTCLITCYIVSLGTAAETIEKLALRVIGCLVGAVAGIAAIVYVMPHLTSIAGLLAIVFPATLISAWIAGGSPRISYAGFQLAFAFFLSVIQGSAPAFDLTIARDRVIGILFGNIVVYVLFTNVWPVSVARRIDPAIAGLLRKLGAAATAAGAAPRSSLLIAAQAERATIDQDLTLARYEPSDLRPPAAWLGARHRAVEQLGALEGPLLLSASRDVQLSQAAAARLEVLADRLSSDAGLAATPADGASKAPPLQSAAAPLGALIERHLSKLEQALAPVAASARADHAPA